MIRDFGILYRTYVQYISKATKDSDLSFSDGVFLVNIGMYAGINQDQLSQALAIDKAAVARSVKRMAQRGYIHIKRPLSDQRAKQLYLTKSGEILYRELQHLNDLWMTNVLDGMDQNTVHALSGMLSTLSDRAKKAKPNA